MTAVGAPVKFSPHEVDQSGMCSPCSLQVNENWIECGDCKSLFHGNCGSQNKALYCCKTFLTTFKALKSPNVIFLCDACLTRREQLEASSLKEQLASMVNSVSCERSKIPKIKSKFVSHKCCH